MVTFSSERRYGGQSQEARIAERRRKLMTAAASLYARVGPANASVAAICSEAGLTARYFYESFENRDALFLAVFEEVCRRLLDLVRAAAQADPADGARRGLFTALLDHPDLARLFLVDLDRHDGAIMAAGFAFAAQLAALLAPQATSMLLRAGAVGAVMRIARLWIASGYAEPIDTVIAAAARFTAAASS